MSNFIHRLRHWAKACPEKIALQVDDRMYTYAELLHEIDALAANLPFPSGSGVLIQETDPAQQWLLFLSSRKAGLRPVLCHPDLPAEDVRNIAESNGLCLFDGTIGPSDVTKIPAAAEFGILSSGSTGLPKLFWREEHSWTDYFPIQNKIFGINEKSRLFFHGSFSFTGNFNSFACVFWAGGFARTISAYAPRRWWYILQEESINTLYLLPVKLRQILRAAKTDIAPAMRAVFTGSQSLDKELSAALQNHFPQALITLYYGAGELNYITYCHIDEWDREPGIVGKPFPQVRVRIKDASIYVTTPFGVIGSDHEMTLGDTGTWTPRGNIRFTGRSNAVINCAGRKISVAKVEDLLRETPLIKDVTIFAVPDTKRGEVPAAAVVVEQKQPLSALRKMALRLPSIERPRYWLQYAELPLNSCSKPDVHAMLADWQATQKKDA